jgi:hypothetical protein
MAGGLRVNLNRSGGAAAIALLLATAWTLAGPVQPAAAFNCAQAKHELRLSSGTVSPGTGQVSTIFSFSVRYTDNAGCAPTLAQLALPGIGAFPLAATGSNWKSGETLALTISLPAGQWDYAFTAASGSGNGSRIVTFTAVTPSFVRVSAAPPPPTPQPTPKPTPRPTPKPAPKATAQPAARPTTKHPSPSPARSAPVAQASPIGPTDSAAPSQQPMGAIGTPDGTAIPAGAGLIGGPDPGQSGSPFVPIALIALVALGGSSGLFVAAVRRRRRHQVTVVVAAPVQAAIAATAQVAIAAPAQAAIAAGDDPYSEAHLPRWRRPSLMAARGRSGRGSVDPDWQLAFAEPTASGTERRRVRYRLARLSDAPDEVRSTDIGQLEANDEVEVLERYAGFILVRTPLGTEGWVHRTTLGPPLGPNGEELDEGEPAT